MLLVFALIILLGWAFAAYSRFLAQHGFVHLLLVPVFLLIIAHFHLQRWPRSERSGPFSPHDQRKESCLLRDDDRRAS